jgi:hypothetical protein
MPTVSRDSENNLHNALDEAEARIEEAAEWLERAGGEAQRLGLPSEVNRHLISLHGAVGETLRHLRRVRHDNQI